MSTKCSIYYDYVTLSTFDGEKRGEKQAHLHMWWDVNEPHIGVGIPGSAENFYIPIDKIDGLIEELQTAKKYWEAIDGD